MEKLEYGIEYKGEIYGRIWESIAWNKEEAEAQRLSNLFFMAAKEDIIADKELAKGNGIKYNSNMYFSSKSYDKEELKDPGSTESLDKILDAAFPNNDDSNKKKELKENLLTTYVGLKKNLADVRVLGVGNSTIEKIGKACKIACKVLINTLGPIATTLGGIGLAAIPAGTIIGSVSYGVPSLLGVTLGPIATAATVTTQGLIAPGTTNVNQPIGNVSMRLASKRSKIKKLLKESGLHNLNKDSGIELKLVDMNKHDHKSHLSHSSTSKKVISKS